MMTGEDVMMGGLCVCVCVCLCMYVCKIIY